MQCEDGAVCALYMCVFVFSDTRHKKGTSGLLCENHTKDPDFFFYPRTNEPEMSLREGDVDETGDGRGGIVSPDAEQPAISGRSNSPDQAKM